MKSAVNIRKMKIKSSATTGIAATLINDGVTMHSLFGIPVPLLSGKKYNIKPGSKQWNTLK
jgi:hypothetical protein